jgi:hypothetical protein
MGWLRVTRTLVGGGTRKRVSGKVFFINGKIPNHFNDNCKTTYNLVDCSQSMTPASIWWFFNSTRIYFFFLFYICVVRYWIARISRPCKLRAYNERTHPDNFIGMLRNKALATQFNTWVVFFILILPDSWVRNN